MTDTRTLEDACALIEDAHAFAGDATVWLEVANDIDEGQMDIGLRVSHLRSLLERVRTLEGEAGFWERRAVKYEQEERAALTRLRGRVRGALTFDEVTEANLARCDRWHKGGDCRLVGCRLGGGYGRRGGGSL